MTIKTNSLPKKKILELIHCAYDEDYRFTLKGSSKERAEKFIHNMRVELSRLREKVRAKRRVIIPFKVKVKSIVELENGNVEVVMFKTLTQAGQISVEVDQELEELVGGSKL